MSLFLYTSLKCFPEMLIFYATLVIGSALLVTGKSTSTEIAQPVRAGI